LRYLGIGASINNIMGFPFETRDLIFDTICMNKKLWQRNQQIESNIFLLTPYRGCEMYDVCRQNGYLEDNLIISSSDMSDKSVLNFPESFKKELTGLLRTFNLYVKMPEQYYDQIRIAELLDEEGNSMLNHLNEILKDQAH
jgi:anaerobic magnesium-protoporphyrin IX monomethyl ester cyclase